MFQKGDLRKHAFRTRAATSKRCHIEIKIMLSESARETQRDVTPKLL